MKPFAANKLGLPLAALCLLQAHPAVAQSGDPQQPALAWQVDYTVDTLHIAQGEETGTRVVGLGSLSAELSLDRLAGWGGAKIRVHAIVSHGAHPNDLAGTMQGIDNIEVADNRARLFEAYFEQELLVYGRGGEPCPRCGRMLKQALVGQRASVWCGHCQR